MSQHTELPPASDLLASDLLHGVAAIARFVGISERQAHWQISQGNLPIVRLGRLIVGSKSQLRQCLTPKPAAARETSVRELA
jgi:hypothetical protein